MNLTLGISGRGKRKHFPWLQQQQQQQQQPTNLTSIDVIDELGVSLLVRDHGPNSAVTDINCGSAFEGFDIEDAEKAVVSGGDNEVADERQLDDSLQVEVQRHQEVLLETAVEGVVDAENVDLATSGRCYGNGGWKMLW